MTNTLYRLHIYNEVFQKLDVVTFKRKHIDIVNFSNFLFSELEEMKSCIYRVETAYAGMRLYWLWQQLLTQLPEETGST